MQLVVLQIPGEGKEVQKHQLMNWSLCCRQYLSVWSAPALCLLALWSLLLSHLFSLSMWAAQQSALEVCHPYFQRWKPCDQLHPHTHFRMQHSLETDGSKFNQGLQFHCVPSCSECSFLPADLTLWEVITPWLLLAALWGTEAGLRGN